MKPAHSYSKISQFQGDPKKFLKKSHDSHTYLIGQTKLPFLAICSPTSQTLAEMYNFSFSKLNRANFCVNSWKIDKEIKCVQDLNLALREYNSAALPCELTHHLMWGNIFSVNQNRAELSPNNPKYFWLWVPNLNFHSALLWSCYWARNLMC